LVKWTLASWHVKHKATETKTETLRKFVAIACPGTTRGHRVMLVPSFEPIWEGFASSKNDSDCNFIGGAVLLVELKPF